jgi:ribosomal peptide maturation radical SAM protein 1
MSPDVLLISMPWCSLYNPSIQTGVLAAVLNKEGVAAACRSYQIDFYDWLASADNGGGPGFAASDYLEISVGGVAQGMGDWCFAEAAFGDDRTSPDPHYLAMLEREGVVGTVLDALRHARRHAAGFVDHCIDDLIAGYPKIVGFTTGFQQTVASLAVARRLKARAPQTRIVFGGADCDGAMGEGLIRAFPYIDAVVRGEGERAIISLAQDAAAGYSIRPFKGLCYRENGAVHAVSRQAKDHIPPDAIPTPDYTDYFARLRRSTNRAVIEPAVEMPIESSRGCWWGEKHHCTFCGFNGAEMAFRSRSAERFLQEVRRLAERYRCHCLMATDAIIDPEYLSTVMPRLVADETDLVFFYETKANLKESHIALLRRAGVLHLQPGIESLSTKILKMMKKGTSASQNIRMLKWCRQYGINALWNIIYGFPREDPAEYSAMARIAPLLAHLQPPSLIPLVVDRFSPYQKSPASYGLEIVGPPRHYAWTMSCAPEVAAEWTNLCYRFEHRHCDGRDPESYVDGLRAAVARWREAFSWDKPSLRYRRGPGFLTLYDERPGFPAAQYKFEELMARVYLACDQGASPRQIAERLGFEPDSESKLRTMLMQFTGRGFMIQEGDVFLSLAIPVKTLDVPFTTII